MSNQCLIAEFVTNASFRNALEVLEKSDCSNEAISIITKPDDVAKTKLSEAVDKTPASAPEATTTADATLGGGLLGGVLGTATMMGPFLVAGPIFGMAAGAIGGQMVSSVESWGVNPDVGQQYEKRVEEGSKLVLLTGDDAELDKGERMLKTCGPRSIDRFEA